MSIADRPLRSRLAEQCGDRGVARLSLQGGHQRRGADDPRPRRSVRRLDRDRPVDGRGAAGNGGAGSGGAVQL
jgi:hypothetical protein